MTEVRAPLDDKVHKLMHLIEQEDLTYKELNSLVNRLIHKEMDIQHKREHDGN